MLTEQKNKTAKLFQFTATTSSPWDEVQFNFWKHKVTNMVLSAIRLALNDDAKTDVNKLLFSTDVNKLLFSYHRPRASCLRRPEKGAANCRRVPVILRALCRRAHPAGNLCAGQRASHCHAWHPSPARPSLRLCVRPSHQLPSLQPVGHAPHCLLRRLVLVSSACWFCCRVLPLSRSSPSRASRVPRLYQRPHLLPLFPHPCRVLGGAGGRVRRPIRCCPHR